MQATLFSTPSQAFRLKPGERITGCSSLLTNGSGRILQAAMNCHQCMRSAHQVVVVTNSSGLHHHAYLCVHHFAEAARTFPELRWPLD
jgi:hypothetical protein